MKMFMVFTFLRGKMLKIKSFFHNLSKEVSQLRELGIFFNYFAIQYNRSLLLDRVPPFSFSFWPPRGKKVQAAPLQTLWGRDFMLLCRCCGFSISFLSAKLFDIDLNFMDCFRGI